MVTTKHVSEIPSSSPVDSNDNYARNMRKSLTVGMNVRCRQSVQRLSISDTGTVIEIKLVNDLHDYNVKVTLVDTQRIIQSCNNLCYT